MATAGGLDLTQPFTRAQGLNAGLNDSQLRRRAFVRLFRGVYLARDTPVSLETRARGALLAAPKGAVVTHHTAAGLWGGSVPPSSAIHVTISRAQSFQTAGVRTHESDRPREITFRRGVRVTTPEQTFIDLASSLDLVELVVLGDRLVKRAQTTPERLISGADAWRGHHRDLACRAAGLVRAGVDSPPESRLRMLVVLAGLPEPTVNHIVRDPDTGEWLRRFELAYRDLLIAIEYEGRQHRDDDEIWAADIERREELDRETWRVVQVINKGLFETPLRTLQRIDQARVDRGARPTVAFNDEWKRYFPGR
jgi:hypothetical protein